MRMHLEVTTQITASHLAMCHTPTVIPRPATYAPNPSLTNRQHPLKATMRIQPVPP